MQEKFDLSKYSSLFLAGHSTGRIVPVFACSNAMNYQTCSWQFKNLNVNISACVLPYTSLHSTAPENNPTILITNSSFAKLNVVGKHRVVIQDHHTGNNGNDTFIQVSNSIVKMTNCWFGGNSNATSPALIWATSSKFVMDNVTMEGVKAKQGLIHMQQSELRMRDVFLFGNGFGDSHSAILATGNSSVIVHKSTFENNVGTNGSCFHIHGNSSLKIENSEFFGNKAFLKGGVISADSASFVLLKSSTFESNTVLNVNGPGGGVIFGEYGVSTLIDSCLFVNNSCQATHLSLPGAACLGGVIGMASFSSVSIQNSTFKGNIGDWGAIVSALMYCNVCAHSTVFKENYGARLIFVAKAEMINLTQSNFLSNMEILPVGDSNNVLVNSGVNASVFVANCIFKDNRHHFVLAGFGTRMYLYGIKVSSNLGGIYSRMNGSISAFYSVFENNALVIDAERTEIVLEGSIFSINKEVIDMGKCKRFVAVNTVFLQNGPRVVRSSENKAIKMENCTFRENYMGPDNALFSLEKTRSAVTLINCMFINNNNMLTYIEHSHVTFIKCTFRYTNTYQGEPMTTIMDNTFADILFIDCVFLLSLRASLTMQGHGGNLTFSRTKINGFWMILTEKCQVKFSKSEIYAKIHGTDEDLKTFGTMMFLLTDSPMMMTDSVAEWNVFGFMLTVGGTITVSNCTFQC